MPASFSTDPVSPPPAMGVADALRSRQAVRSFQPDPVPRAIVAGLLAAAGQAPSGGNLQPWHVFVVSGATKAALTAATLAKLERGEREAPEYEIYPKALWEPLRARRREAGAQRYAAAGLSRADDGQLELERRNLRFFGAPVGLFFCLDRRVGPPQWADLGMFMQSVMLLATAQGLATCPQEMWSAWPESVAAALALPPGLLVFAGMSLGYADPASPMNAYRTPRVDPGDYVSFLE